MNYVYDSTTNSYNYASASAATNSYSANLQSAKAANVAVTTVTDSCCHCNTEDDTAQFLNQYQFLMKGLSGAADKLRSLNSSGLWSNYVAQSSDTTGVEVSQKAKLTAKANYDVTVSQLASGQTTNSEMVKSSEAATIDGQFKIEIPNTSKNININVETAGRTNSEVQGDIAAQINKANVGLTAVVIEADGKSYVEIKSESGAKNAFSVQESSKFSTSVVAKNLQYTLSKDGVLLNEGKSYQSASNENVMIDGYRISADFKKTGNVKIKVGADTEAIGKATEEFVNEYNKTLEFLVKNAHRGTGISKTLDNLIRSPISKDSMKTIGITREENGKFTFDKKKFEQALKDNSSKVYDILSDNYSIADGIHQDVQRGLREPIETLTNRQVSHTVVYNFYTQPPIYIYNNFGMGTNPFQRPFFLDLLG